MQSPTLGPTTPLQFPPPRPPHRSPTLMTPTQPMATMAIIQADVEGSKVKPSESDVVPMDQSNSSSVAVATDKQVPVTVTTKASNEIESSVATTTDRVVGVASALGEDVKVGGGEKTEGADVVKETATTTEPVLESTVTTEATHPEIQTTPLVSDLLSEVPADPSTETIATVTETTPPSTTSPTETTPTMELPQVEAPPTTTTTDAPPTIAATDATPTLNETPPPPTEERQPEEIMEVGMEEGAKGEGEETSEDREKEGEGGETKMAGDQEIMENGGGGEVKDDTDVEAAMSEINNAAMPEETAVLLGVGGEEEERGAGAGGEVKEGCVEEVESGGGDVEIPHSEPEGEKDHHSEVDTKVAGDPTSESKFNVCASALSDILLCIIVDTDPVPPEAIQLSRTSPEAIQPSSTAEDVPEAESNSHTDST